MITIQNVKMDKDKPGGEALYEIRINRDLKALFYHKRSEGLAECLRAAANAIETTERHKWAIVAQELGMDSHGW